MRLLVYNPNSNPDLTAALSNAVGQLLQPDDVLRTATGRAGEAFIGSEDSIDAAKAALRKDLPRRASDCDAVLLGCFGDLGVDDARQELRRPIISLSEAFFATAPLLGRRIGVLTTSPFWASRLAIEARRKDAVRWIADTRSLDVCLGEPSASLVARCRSAIAEIAKDDRCEAVVLGGAMLIALTTELARGSPLPLIDSLAAGVGLCRTAHACLALSATPESTIF